jgi:hypothetical protein
MRASLRVIRILAAAALGIAPAIALAQATSAPPTANSAAPDTIGPSELQHFSLPGTRTRPVDQPPAETAAPPRGAPAPRTAVPAPRRTADRPAERAAPPASVAVPVASAPPPPSPSEEPAASATVALPPVGSSPTPSAAAPMTSEAAPAPDESFVQSGKLWLWPWLAAALALAGGVAFLLWRRRPRAALAAGPLFDLLVPAAPAPEPQPQPAPPGPVPARPKAAPAASGIVASRLRPSLEIGFQPLRCLLEDEQVTIEFELELFNAGAAPARAVLAEASLFNAGATQEQELAAFFANPHGAGERLEIIQPMKRVGFKSQVVAPRAAVQEYQLGGRKAFVPVIAFNALYEWSGGKAQTSAAYLVGRDTQSDKLGPLRVDQGARDYRGLGARPLPSALRT